MKQLLPDRSKDLTPLLPPFYDNIKEYNRRKEMQKKKGRPQKYVFWSDWEAWLLKEWNPFKGNDLPHMQNDIAWLKRIMTGILIAIVGLALAVIILG